MDVLLKLGIVLAVGFLGGKLASLAKLPSVSGYLVVGLLLGPTVTRLITNNDLDSFAILSEVALSILAFSIGSEFIMSDMLKLGKKIFWITLLEVIGAILVVFVMMFFIFQKDFAFSIVIAAMSAATAPAATILVMRQYRANGPLTKTILPVVALDDVFGIIAFGIAIAIAKLTVSTEPVSALKLFTQPLIEVGGSFLLGFALGVILSFVAKKARNRDEYQLISLAGIAIATGLANWLGLSSLLTNILMGTVVVNLVKNPNRMFSSVNDFSNPFFVLFFTLAGASLDLNILVTVGFVGIGYVFARAAGKFLGAWFGAKVTKAEPVVQKYLGLALLPQGGISIGLSVIVRQQLPQYAPAIITIIMFSVLIYETSGPIFAKIALKKAGEIHPDVLLELESRKIRKKAKLQNSEE